LDAGAPTSLDCRNGIAANQARGLHAKIAGHRLGLLFLPWKSRLLACPCKCYLPALDPSRHAGFAEDSFNRGAPSVIRILDGCERKMVSGILLISGGYPLEYLLLTSK
jgi:hypothetical protein